MLLLEEEKYSPGIGHTKWKCLIKSGKRIKPDTRIRIDSHLTALVTAVKPQGVCEVSLFHEGDLLRFLTERGHVPLPPYIRRQDEPEDRHRYQTVYARHYGSAAAPTAGLHFSRENLDRLRDKGVEVAEVTLHIGLGTFRPIREKDVRNHHMHREMVEISPQAVYAIKHAKRLGKRIVAVGTTTVRVLEFMTDSRGEVRSGRELCDLYIYPGYRFKMVDGMITNFHQPRSSLLVLCSAFTGSQVLLRAYHEAISMRYRFLSYGDAMFIV
jgi:S-adenosylmethionine:tRNA ribosyltransferase-isomerase